jgi:flagellar motility protein MotE (MotC chaperone)
MIRRIRDFRLVPIVIVATICLFMLKTFGLVFDGGYLFSDVAARKAEEADITGTIAAPKRDKADVVEAPSPAPVKATPSLPPKPTLQPTRKPSWAQEMFNFPDVTGSTGETKSNPHAGAVHEKDAAPKAKPQEPPPTAGWTPVAVAPHAQPSSAERALLERLGERRAELEARAKELDMRENLMKAAEKRVEARIAELKGIEKRVNAAAEAKDGAEAARFKNVVTMYENMKAKDAAKIFDRLDLKVLVEVSTKINPRRMSDILAQMTPAAAERLTVELASRSDTATPTELPKIEGHPTAN